MLLNFPQKFERRSEQEAEASLMRFLDFTHTESETANEIIDRVKSGIALASYHGFLMPHFIPGPLMIRVSEMRSTLLEACARTEVGSHSCPLVAKSHKNSIPFWKGEWKNCPKP